VPKANIFIASGECDNYSALNWHNADQAALDDSSSKRGGTMQGILGYVRKYKPVIFASENVRKMAGTQVKDGDLAKVVKILNGFGQLCYVA